MMGGSPSARGARALPSYRIRRSNPMARHRAVHAYPKEDKLRAVALSAKLGPMKAAEELGIKLSTLNNWVYASRQGRLKPKAGEQVPTVGFSNGHFESADMIAWKDGFKEGIRFAMAQLKEGGA